MKFQIGAMSVGDILDRGLKLLLARLPALYIINLIVLSPVLAYQLVMPLLLRQQDNEASPLVLGGIMAGTMFMLVLTIILQPIGTAAILHIISREFIDRHVGIGAAFGFALSRFGSLLAASILAGLMIGFGFLFCLVPGFIFWTLFAFFAQVIVVEGLSATASLNRSMELGKGYRWRIFFILILTAVLTFASQMVLAAGLAVVLPASETVPIAGGGYRIVQNIGNQTIHTLVTQLVAILFGAFQAVCLTLLYFDLRIRKEGYDLEVAAQGEQDVPLAELDEPQVDLPEA